MKKILWIFVILMMLSTRVYAVDEFLTGEPEGARNISTIDDYVEDNNISLVRLLADVRRDCFLSYASAATLTVGTGSVGCTNSAKSILRTRKNTSALTLTWSNIDTGNEANSTTYYVYAAADADTATFTGVISTNSTTPTGLTYYSKLGSFYNNSSGNITQVSNGNMVGTVPSGTICMWHGLITAIPSGWVLCDGTNSTPDLAEKFVRGAADSTEAGGTGGSDTQTHTYSGTTASEGGDWTGDWQAGTAATPAHTHTYSGTTASSDNMPAYYSILFIMRQ